MLNDISSDDRARLWSVYFVALSVIATEVVSFQAISFVNDYMRAVQVIAVALMGIALGGLLSYFVDKQNPDRASTWVLAGLPLSVLATFFIIIWLNPMPVLMMALATLPYLFASLYISLMFNHLRPSRVYFFDLCGAGVGAFLVVIIIPVLREEGSFFLLTGLSAVPLLLSARIHGAHASLARRLGRVFITASLGLLIVHSTIDPFNMMHIATADRAEFPRKLFLNWDNPDGTPRWRLLYSRGSLIERIDILQKTSKKDKRYWSVYNGRIVDWITRSKAKVGWYDNRLPTHLKAGQDPETLLVGPSGQGLCKAVRALGNGRVDAVEINGAIAGLMMNEMYKRSGEAYAGFNLTIGDARTFLATTARKYDYITMLNTHRIWSMGHTGPPEYIHTYEAMRAYIDHLKDDGYVLFEERNINERAHKGITRMLFTLKAAMKDAGIEDPAKNLAIWELWHDCPKARFLQERCNPKLLFTFIMAKKTAITVEEYAHLIEWAEILGARKPRGGKNGGYRGIVWRYLPQLESDHFWAQAVKSDDIYALPGNSRDLHLLDVVHDDRPFPYDVFIARTGEWKVFKTTAWLAFFMVLLPAIVVFRLRKNPGAAPGKQAVRTNALMVPYFAVIGVAYLLIEIVLIQKFGIFVNSPVYSMVVVLSTMLISSGAGGLFSARVSGSKTLLALALVAVLSALYAFALDPMMNAAFGLSFPLRVLVAVALIAPLGFIMGMPFPVAMDLVKQRLTPRHAGLYFGINGALGAIATPLSILLSMVHGFTVTMLVGAAIYLVCALLFALAKGGEPDRAGQTVPVDGTAAG